MLYSCFELVGDLVVSCFNLFSSLMLMSKLWPVILGMFVFSLGFRFVLVPMFGGDIPFRMDSKNFSKSRRTNKRRK